MWPKWVATPPSQFDQLTPYTSRPIYVKMDNFAPLVQIWQMFEFLETTFWPFYVVKIEWPYHFNLSKLVHAIPKKANTSFQCYKAQVICGQKSRGEMPLLLPLLPCSKTPIYSYEMPNGGYFCVRLYIMLIFYKCAFTEFSLE